VLPLPFSKRSSATILGLPGRRHVILEISHRSKPFESILARAEADIRTLGNYSVELKVLFLQGGASTQSRWCR